MWVLRVLPSLELRVHIQALTRKEGGWEEGRWG